MSDPINSLFDDPDAPDEEEADDEGPEEEAPAPMKGDAYWAQIAAPILARVQLGPATLSSIVTHGGPDVERTRQAVCWLENRKEVESFKNFQGHKQLRIPGGRPRPERPKGSPVVTPAPPEQLKPNQARLELIQQRKKEITPMATKEKQEKQEDWITVVEAAELLGVNASAVTYQIKGGKYAKTMRAEIRGRPLMVLRSEVLARKAEAVVAGETPPRKAKAPRAAKAVAPVARKAAAGIATDVEAQVRWVVTGYQLGRFDSAQALEQIVELLNV